MAYVVSDEEQMNFAGPTNDLEEGVREEFDFHSVNDLPEFLRKGVQFAPPRWKKTFVAIEFFVQFGLFIPILGYITGSTFVGVLASGYLFLSNMPLLLQPDFTKGVFLQILLRNAALTRKISKNTYKGFVSSLIVFLLIPMPMFWYFFIVPFANDSNAFGESTHAITIAIACIATLCTIPMFMMNSCQTLPDQVSVMHISKIKQYLKKVRDAVMNGREGNGNFMTDVLSKEQELVEKWIVAVNNGMSTYTSIQLCNLILSCIFFLALAAGRFSVGATVTCTICAVGICFMIGNTLYAVAKPNMTWEQQKILLLNDANVMLNLQLERDNFETWLNRHNFNASRAFGTKVTFDKMKGAVSAVFSLFGMALYFLIRTDVEVMLQAHLG